jgi:hypothetical protein
MMKMNEPQIKVTVLASDPAGAGVAFPVTGWKSAHQLRRKIEGWPNREYGWKFVMMVRQSTQKELG